MTEKPEWKFPGVDIKFGYGDQVLMALPRGSIACTVVGVALTLGDSLLHAVEENADIGNVHLVPADRLVPRRPVE